MAAVEQDDDGLLIEVQELRTNVQGFHTTVNTLTATVTHLSTQMAGLIVSADQGIYGEAYADDDGPAVRAKFFEREARITQEHEKRIVDLA